MHTYPEGFGREIFEVKEILDHEDVEPTDDIVKLCVQFVVGLSTVDELHVVFAREGYPTRPIENVINDLMLI